jgi:hypothetical protein
MNTLKNERRAAVVRCLVEGNSIRSTEDAIDEYAPDYEQPQTIESLAAERSAFLATAPTDLYYAELPPIDPSEDKNRIRGEVRA